jgi:plasmid rolling circle replication initiator protein Rep
MRTEQKTACAQAFDGPGRQAECERPKLDQEQGQPTHKSTKSGEKSSQSIQRVCDVDRVRQKFSAAKRYTQREVIPYMKAAYKAEAFGLMQADFGKWIIRCEDCGRHIEFRIYPRLGIKRLTKAFFCKKNLICRVCAIVRSGKLVREVSSKIDSVHGRYRYKILITATVKNGPNLVERFDHLTKSLQLMHLRGRNFLRGKSSIGEFAKILGCTTSVEITKPKEEWHPHAHMIALTNQLFDLDKINEEWRLVTGDSVNINVTGMKRRDDGKSELIEALKYSVKYSDMTPQDLCIIQAKLNGRRLFSTRGMLRGIKDDVVTDEVADLVNEPFFTMVLKYAEEQGLYRMEWIDEKKEKE